MAIVSKTESMFGKMRFMKVVKFSSKTNLFSINMPAGAEPVCGKEVTGHSMKEVEKAYREASELFTNSTLVKSKVIVMEFGASCYIERDDKLILEMNDSWGHSDGLKICLSCGVFEKHSYKTVNDRAIEEYKEIHTITDSTAFGNWGPSPGDNDIVEIPWTKEREQFFLELSLALENIIIKLNEFSQDKKSILKFINKRIKLLNA